VFRFLRLAAIWRGDPGSPRSSDNMKVEAFKFSGKRGGGAPQQRFWGGFECVQTLARVSQGLSNLRNPCLFMRVTDELSGAFQTNNGGCLGAKKSGGGSRIMFKGLGKNRQLCIAFFLRFTLTTGPRGQFFLFLQVPRPSKCFRTK